MPRTVEINGLHLRNRKSWNESLHLVLFLVL